MFEFLWLATWLVRNDRWCGVRQPHRAVTESEDSANKHAWQKSRTLKPPPTRKSIRLLGPSWMPVALCAVVAALLFGCTQSPSGMTGSGRPKPGEAVQHFNRGVDLDRQKNFAGAVAEYTEAIKIHNGYMEAYFNRGIARANLGDHTGSVSDFTEVLKIDTNHTNAYRNRAIQRDMQGDLAGAIADYTEVLERDATQVDILAQKGLAHLKAGNDSEAQRDFDRAFQLKPDIKGQLEAAIAEVKQQRAQSQE